jgi:predicted nucleic acid-binding protein
VTSPRLVVLDASVGVKWFKDEIGSDDARRLLSAHRDGEIRLVVPAIFAHELVATAVRFGGPDFGREAWEHLAEAEVTVVSLDAAFVSAALAQCAALSCSFYDALAPALADQLGATLYSADARAHSEFPGVVLIDA